MVLMMFQSQSVSCFLQPVHLYLPSHCSSYTLAPLIQNAPSFSIWALPVSCRRLLISAKHRDTWQRLIAGSAPPSLNFYHTLGGLCQRSTQKTQWYQWVSIRICHLRSVFQFSMRAMEMGEYTHWLSVMNQNSNSEYLQHWFKNNHP